MTDEQDDLRRLGQRWMQADADLARFRTEAMYDPCIDARYVDQRDDAAAAFWTAFDAYIDARIAASIREASDRAVAHLKVSSDASTLSDEEREMLIVKGMIDG